MGCAWAAFHTRHWGLDDAYISYRYAENLLAGRGLVFNPGERVEGYTNLLHVLLMVPGLALFGREGVHAWSVAIGSLASWAALYAVAAASRLRVGDPGALLVALAFALSPAVWISAASGLETALVVALFATGWAALAKLEAGGPEDRRRRAAALPVLAAALAGMVLVRADGFVMAGIFLLRLALRDVPAGRWRELTLCAGVAVGTTGLQVAWRLAYYGYPLPNSYHAKVSGSLAERLDFAMELLPHLHAVQPALLAILLAALAFAVGAVRRVARAGLRAGQDPLAFEIFFPLCWLAYWLYVGGDVFGARFLIPLIPLGATILLLRGIPLAVRAPRVASVVAPVLLLAFLAWPWWESGLRLERTRYDPWIALGRFLGEQHPGALLAVDAAGKIPFFSGLEAIDVYGLNDATIAHRESDFLAPGHSKTDPYYVLGRNPEVITGWIDPGDLELEPGFERYLYTGEGYALRHLVFAFAGASPPEGEPAVRDAGELSPQEVRAQWRRGYRYGVLIRGDPSRPPPRAGAAPPASAP